MNQFPLLQFSDCSIAPYNMAQSDRLLHYSCPLLQVYNINCSTFTCDAMKSVTHVSLLSASSISESKKSRLVQRLRLSWVFENCLTPLTQWPSWTGWKSRVNFDSTWNAINAFLQFFVIFTICLLKNGYAKWRASSSKLVIICTFCTLTQTYTKPLQWQLHSNIYCMKDTTYFSTFRFGRRSCARVWGRCRTRVSQFVVCTTCGVIQNTKIFALFWFLVETCPGVSPLHGFILILVYPGLCGLGLYEGMLWTLVSSEASSPFLDTSGGAKFSLMRACSRLLHCIWPSSQFAFINGCMELSTIKLCSVIWPSQVLCHLQLEELWFSYLVISK